MKPRISILVCTRNRAAYLRRALESVVAQTLPADAFETLVIDNGSTDDTNAVAESFAAAARVRYLHEPAVGLCHARNTGWRAAQADYVAYLDDDAVAEPRWLEETLKTFETVQPQPGCVGGRVDPAYEAPRPGWLSDDLSLGLTIVNWPGEAHPIRDLRVEWLVGANIAFPRRVLEQLGGFHPALDRSGTQMLSSGDVYLQRLILEAGYPCYYQPRAAVRHLVPAGRLTKRWFVSRYYWQGVSDAVMEILHDRPSGSARRRSALGRAAKLLRSPRQMADLLVPTSDPERFTKKCWALIAVGHITGLLNVRA